MISRECLVCGREIKCYKSTYDKKKYCSKECKEKITHIESKCIVCGENYLIAKSRHAGLHMLNKCCSGKCYKKYRHEENKKIKSKHTHSCSLCEKVFTSRRTCKTSLRFCSQKCSKKYMRGEKSPFYKGGTFLQSGYKVIKVDTTYKLEHRLIVEKFIGRKLKKNEIVHHVDGDKKNNSIENLQIMDKKEHDKLHFEERRTRKNGNTM